MYVDIVKMVEKVKNFLTPPTHQGRLLSADMVLQQLHRIFDSPEFEGTKAQRAFFNYVVKKTIEGKSDEIKAYTVATEVFGRGEDFDQNTDPIVSIQAHRLRRALERYYLVAGQNDPIHIDIPKGTYVPVFTEQIQPPESLAAIIERHPDVKTQESWPTLLIKQFKNLTKNPERDFIGMGLSMELATEISRFDETNVIFPRDGQNLDTETANARFALDGTVYEQGSLLHISAQLIDLKSGSLLWTEIQQLKFEPEKLFALQQQISNSICTRIGGEYGIIPNAISRESRIKPPNALSTYEAILRFYEYDQSFTPESFRKAFEALRQAANAEPSCGQIWSLLGRLYANIYSLDYPGFENPLEIAIEYAERGCHLNPNNQRAIAILAFVRFLSNELPTALEDARRAIELNPNSLLFLDSLAYLMILAGKWERGTELARKVIKLNPCYRPILHYALWFDCLRQKHYDQAYRETMGVRRPLIFWYPLSKAATLGLLGRIEEGKEFAGKLLELKPDFPNKARVLIGRYIKFEEVAERVIEGLNKVGIEID